MSLDFTRSVDKTRVKPCHLSMITVQDKVGCHKVGYSHSVESLVYRLYMSLMSDLLEKLKSGFVTDTVNFIGVHQERLHQVS